MPGATSEIVTKIASGTTSDLSYGTETTTSGKMSKHTPGEKTSYTSSMLTAGTLRAHKSDHVSTKQVDAVFQSEPKWQQRI